MLTLTQKILLIDLHKEKKKYKYIRGRRIRMWKMKKGPQFRWLANTSAPKS